MKKILLVLAFITSLSASTQASAMATEATALVNAASNVATEAKTAVMEAWNKSAWVQQLQGLWQSLQKLQGQLNEMMGLRDDFMNTLSGPRGMANLVSTDKGVAIGGDGGSDATKPNYHYADKFPTRYTEYIGLASGTTSKEIRKNWKVSNSQVTLTSNNVNEFIRQEAESNAQQLSVIHAMAEEAYAQAALRVDIIANLEQKITNAKKEINSKSTVESSTIGPWKVETGALEGVHSFEAAGSTGTASSTKDGNTIPGSPATPSSKTEMKWRAEGISKEIGTAEDAIKASTASGSPDINRNDLKYIADLQAQIQVQQALLQNEQNKLAALAILQRSQRDAHEQRNREFAAYALYRKNDDGEHDWGVDIYQSVLKYGSVALAQGAGYELVKKMYK